MITITDIRFDRMQKAIIAEIDSLIIRLDTVRDSFICGYISAKAAEKRAQAIMDRFCIIDRRYHIYLNACNKKVNDGEFFTSDDFCDAYKVIVNKFEFFHI